MSQQPDPLYCSQCRKFFPVSGTLPVNSSHLRFLRTMTFQSFSQTNQPSADANQRHVRHMNDTGVVLSQKSVVFRFSDIDRNGRKRRTHKGQMDYSDCKQQEDIRKLNRWQLSSPLGRRKLAAALLPSNQRPVRTGPFPLPENNPSRQLPNPHA